MSNQVSVAVFWQTLLPCCSPIARVTEAGEFIVTPTPAAIVVEPAPPCVINTLVPTGKATVLLGGKVSVLAAAFVIETPLRNSSPTTRV